MGQLTLASQGGFEQYGKKTRREKFLEEMDRILPWAELESLIEPYYPKAGNGRPPVGLSIMLRIYFLQHWFNLSDPAAEEALYDSPALRRFAGVDLGRAAAPAIKSYVAVVRDQTALDPSNQVNEPALRGMLTQVLKMVTGKADPASAWRVLVRTSDIVGLVHTDHLNRTHPELVELVKATLREAGVPEKNIWMVQGSPDKVKECNALISLPALKAHWLTGIGTVFKNYITFTGSPSSYHDANNAKLGEIWNMPHVKGKTKLVLVDALRSLCDKGPQPDPRYMWQYKGLIAGTDPVAVETVCLKVIMQKRQALRGEPWPLSPPPMVVEMADKRYGLGTSNLEEIQINRVGWMENVLV